MNRAMANPSLHESLRDKAAQRRWIQMLEIQMNKYTRLFILPRDTFLLNAAHTLERRCKVVM
jgi:hypothetical protein